MSHKSGDMFPLLSPPNPSYPFATKYNLHRGHGEPRRFYFAHFVNIHRSVALRDLDVDSRKKRR